jgi:hypothetical protein
VMQDLAGFPGGGNVEVPPHTPRWRGVRDTESAAGARGSDCKLSRCPVVSCVRGSQGPPQVACELLKGEAVRFRP